MASTAALLQKTDESQERALHHTDTLPKMTPELLQDICKERHMWTQPQLNTQLYLNYKGFQKMEGLEDYINIKSLHLDNNNITKIECLDRMTELRSLHLGGNRIAHIENLGSCPDLRQLNLEGNAIKTVANVRSLLKLETLNLAANQIENIEDLSELRDLPCLMNIDVSSNAIESIEGVVEFWSELKTLRVLRYHGNPGVRSIEHYRKRILNALPQLSYMDERPVFPVERKASQAWAEGGLPAMQEARKEFHRLRHAECGVDPERRDLLTKRRQMAIERMDREAKEREERDLWQKEQETKQQQWQEKKASNVHGGAGKDVEDGDEKALEEYAGSWHQKVNLYGVEGVREKVAKDAAAPSYSSKPHAQERAVAQAAQRDQRQEFAFAPPARNAGEQLAYESPVRKQRGPPATVADFRDRSSATARDTSDLHIAAFGDGEALPLPGRSSKLESTSGHATGRHSGKEEDGHVMPLIWQNRQKEVAAAEAACLEMNMSCASCEESSTSNPAAFRSNSGNDLAGLD